MRALYGVGRVITRRKLPAVRLLSYHDGQNPYETYEGDDRFLQYQALMFRNMNSYETFSRSLLQGPSTLVIPGLPISVFNGSAKGFISRQSLSEGYRAYPHDASTNIPDKDLSCKAYPLITIPALVMLYLRICEGESLMRSETINGDSLSNHNKSSRTFDHNETWTNAENFVHAIAIRNVEKFNYLMPMHCKDLLAATKDNYTNAVLYISDLGKCFELNLDKLRKIELAAGNNADEFALRINNNTQYIGNETAFPKNVFTVDNVKRDLNMKNFLIDCYSRCLDEVAYSAIQYEEKKLSDHYIEGYYRRNTHVDTPVIMDVLFSDVAEWIKEKGTRAIIRDVENHLDKVGGNVLMREAIGLQFVNNSNHNGFENSGNSRF